MKLEIEREWCIRMAQIEGDAEIGAGRLAVDPVFDGDVVPAAADDEAGSNAAARSGLGDSLIILPPT